jgi:hypothetical protein
MTLLHDETLGVVVAAIGSFPFAMTNGKNRFSMAGGSGSILNKEGTIFRFPGV